MSAPRVSVVIPCFNYGHHLAECVESVLGQTLREVEVIVVDDGSTDDSREVADRLIAEHPGRDVRLIAKQNEGAPARSRNVGIEAARAELILCLDADDRIDARFLAACADALDRDPRAGFAYGEQQLFGDDDTFIASPDWDPQREIVVNFVSTASMFRREAWRQVGGYDTDPGLVGYEDWDFWIGCIERGWDAVHVPGAIWHYRVHGSGVYAKNKARDPELKARIVRKHPALYNPAQRRWAEGVLTGDATALALQSPVGIMPQLYAGDAVRVAVISREGDAPARLRAQLLAQAGAEVHLVTRAGTGEQRVRNDGEVTVHDVPEPGLGVPEQLGYLEIPLWSYVAGERIAQLDAAFPLTAVEVDAAAGEALHVPRRAHTRLVARIDAPLPTETGDARAALLRAALDRADLLLAAHDGLSDRDALVIPEPRALRGAANPLRVIATGRLEAARTPELALRAVAFAAERGADIELTLAGADDDAYRTGVLEPLRSQLGLERVRYAPASLEEADVAILAARHEPALTVAAALAAGVPAIGADPGCALELSAADREGFVRAAGAALANRDWIAGARAAAARLRDAARFELAALVEPRELEGSRRHVVLAELDELLEDRSLLAAWARSFDARDDVTLAIHAPGTSAEQAGALLGPVVAEAGLDSEAAADLLAVAAPRTAELERRLRLRAAAILSRRAAADGGPPVVGPESLRALRAALGLREDAADAGADAAGAAVVDRSPQPVR